jgi:hypothetical protein
MSSVKMKEVSVIALEGRSVLVAGFDGPVIKGDGDMSYVSAGADKLFLKMSLINRLRKLP